MSHVPVCSRKLRLKTDIFLHTHSYSGSAHGDGMGRNSGDIAYSGMNTSSLNRTTSAPKSGDIAYLGMNTLSLNRTTSLQSPPGTPNKFLNETTSRRKRGSEDSPPELRGYAFDRHNSNLSTTDEDGNRDGGDEWEVLACDIRVEKKVGEGAFGEIRKATWKGCEVAVKTLKADCQNDVIALKDFNREMSIWSRLVHPNVVQFLGVGYKRNVPRIMICEFMEGGSLQQKLMSLHHSGKKMLLDQGFGLLKGIASAMTYMHSRRPFAVFHRDLKPANILLTAAGEAKLADFGLSKMLDIETPRAPRLSTASASPSSYNSTEDLDVDVTDVIGGAFPETSKNVLPSPSVFGKAFSFLTPINNETGVKPTEAELVEADQLESRRNNYGEKLYSTLYDHSILMTGETGAYKYMAPEVFKNEAYGLKVLISHPAVWSTVGNYYPLLFPLYD